LQNTKIGWFVLSRHDEDPAKVEPPVADPTKTPEAPKKVDDKPADPDPADDDGKPSPAKDLAEDVAKWKALARKHEQSAKSNADAAKKLAEIEDAQKTEAEKLQAAKDAAEARTQKALRRAVAAEIKVLAKDADFADPSDAETAVNPDDYLDKDGEIDVEGIKARLAEILEKKPHWRKTADETLVKPKTPKPDPGQGSRGDKKPVDYRTASDEDYRAELTRLGVRVRPQ